MADYSSRMLGKISILCPMYNEADVLEKMFAELVPVLEELGGDYEIICVNDGSQDGTLVGLVGFMRRYPKIKIIDLSRNFGKEAALTAALDHATGDAVIPFDADLQDPPCVIKELVCKWREGADVVLACRADRSSDSWLKRVTALLFYKIHNFISDVNIPSNVGDFRLMDKEVVRAVKMLPESRRFMKGVFSWVGFRTEVVNYVREKRVAGVSKFNGWKLWNFALEGITSFSTAPLRIWFYVGLLIALAAIGFAILIIGKTVIYGVAVPGYASLMVSVLFIGGVQLVGIGVLGEYIGRIYLESKRRPVYIVREVYQESCHE